MGNVSKAIDLSLHPSKASVPGVLKPLTPCSYRLWFLWQWTAMNFGCRLSVRCLGPREEWGGVCVGIAGCSDEERCQQVLDGKWCLKPDLQMCKPPGFQKSAPCKRFSNVLRRWLRLALIPPECFRVNLFTWPQKSVESFAADHVPIARQAPAPSLTSPLQPRKRSAYRVLILQRCFKSGS